MQKVVFFYIHGCPYCTQARKAIAELVAEHPEYAKVEFEEHEEHEEPEIADQYDYWCTPSMFVGGEKLYESHLFEPYEEAKAHVKEVLDRALAS